MATAIAQLRQLFPDLPKDILHQVVNSTGSFENALDFLVGTSAQSYYQQIPVYEPARNLNEQTALDVAYEGTSFADISRNGPLMPSPASSGSFCPSDEGFGDFSSEDPDIYESQEILSPAAQTPFAAITGTDDLLSMMSASLGKKIDAIKQEKEAEKRGKEEKERELAAENDRRRQEKQDAAWNKIWATSRQISDLFALLPPEMTFAIALSLPPRSLARCCELSRTAAIYFGHARHWRTRCLVDFSLFFRGMKKVWKKQSWKVNYGYAAAKSRVGRICQTGANVPVRFFYYDNGYFRIPGMVFTWREHYIEVTNSTEIIRSGPFWRLVWNHATNVLQASVPPLVTIMYHPEHRIATYADKAIARLDAQDTGSNRYTVRVTSRINPIAHRVLVVEGYVPIFFVLTVAFNLIE